MIPSPRPHGQHAALGLVHGVGPRRRPVRERALEVADAFPLLRFTWIAQESNAGLRERVAARHTSIEVRLVFIIAEAGGEHYQRQ